MKTRGRETRGDFVVYNVFAIVLNPFVHIILYFSVPMTFTIVYVCVIGRSRVDFRCI